MRLSDLQNKDVVDILTGEKIGNVIDTVWLDAGQLQIIINLRKRTGG